jgi:hypothetical protein
MKSTSLFLLSMVLLLSIHTKCFFNRAPDYTFDTLNNYPSTVIKTSPYQNSVVIGYTNGNVALYSIDGDQLALKKEHSSPIVGIEWLSLQSGYVTVEEKGKAVRWSEDGKKMASWKYNQTALGMTHTSTYFGDYVAINFGNNIVEYNAITGKVIQTYLTNSSETRFLAI